MKREQYYISVNQIRVRTKYAWNSARREVPVVIKEFFLHHGTATKQSGCYFKDEDGRHNEGYETWITDKGVTLNVKIEKKTL